MFWRRRRDDTALTSAPIRSLLDTGKEAPSASPVSARDRRRARLLEDPDTVMRVAPRRGWPSPYAGRAASLPQAEVFRADTAMAAGLYPFLHAVSLPAVGVYIGWDVHTQSAFSAHPSVWVTEGLATNPNLMITGIPGSGKSAHVKALCLRMMAVGHRTLIAGDIKGEYADLCRYLGAEPVRLGPGLPGRINPLDAGPLGADLHTLLDKEQYTARLTEIRRRRLALLGALLELQLHRPLDPREEEALRVALREVTGELAGNSRLENPTLPTLQAVLTDPTPAMTRALRIRGEDIQTAREEMATLRSALGGMIDGHLSGLFDGPTSVELDWNAPIQSVDISALQNGYADETVAMVLTCVSSWAQSEIDRPGKPVIVVRDELWRQIRSGGSAMVGKIDSDLRLSRADGTIQILATHRLEDFEALAGDAGGIATNLIASCATRVQLAQDTRPLAVTRDAIGLTDAECAMVGSWGAAHRGRALWKVDQGAAGYAVQLVLSPIEQKLFHTDERMTA